MGLLGLNRGWETSKVSIKGVCKTTMHYNHNEMTITAGVEGLYTIHTAVISCIGNNKDQSKPRTSAKWQPVPEKVKSASKVKT